MGTTKLHLRLLRQVAPGSRRIGDERTWSHICRLRKLSFLTYAYVQLTFVPFVLAGLVCTSSGLGC